MDFLDPKKKRAQRHRLIFGYLLIGIAIALVTVILGFQTYGYDLDRKTGSIIQNGLVFVTAQPQPADIFLNSKQYKTQADARLVLPSDVYKLELKRSGYRNWSRSFSLAGGTIERFVYPFLFPVKLSTKVVKTYPTATDFLSQSPDRHWLLTRQAGQVNVFDEFDTTAPSKKPITLTIPADMLNPATPSKLTTVEWSSDNKHVLVRNEFAGGSEFVMIDRSAPKDSYNVNKTIKTDPTEIALHDKNYQQLYTYDAATRQLSDVDVKTVVSKPVAANVLAFKSYGNDIILYATDQDASAGKVRLMFKDKDGSYLLREAPTSPTYLLNLAQYNNAWYVAVGSQSDNRVYVYKNPQAIIKQAKPATQLYPETVLRVDNPSWLGFSTSAQFLALQSGSQFAVYDAENQRNFRYDLHTPLDAEAPKASWMDGNRLILNSQGKMVVVDYDGTNQQTLTANQAGTIPAFDRNYRELYNIAPSAGGSQLTRLDLDLSNPIK